MPSMVATPPTGTEASIPTAACTISKPGHQRKQLTRRPSIADLRRASAIKPLSLTDAIKTTGTTTGTAMRATSPVIESLGIISPLTKENVSTMQANMGKEMHMTNAPTVIVRCQCPPPLEFPEYVKREMKREEEEHRQRECGLYAKQKKI
ncbi:hypothetical protein BGZ54_003485 [Gamsiella multidivaricata]|nr:hypothetical protein BGZ54_003485 [Gamsiella multidivaricata]